MAGPEPEQERALLALGRAVYLLRVRAQMQRDEVPGIDERYLRDLEAGRRSVGWSVLHRFMRGVGVNAEEFGRAFDNELADPTPDIPPAPAKGGRPAGAKDAKPRTRKSADPGRAASMRRDASGRDRPT